MIASFYLTLQSRWVQTAIISVVTGKISEETNADIKIRRVSYSFFDRLILNDVYISDQQKDTMLYVKKMVAEIDSLSLSSKRLSIGTVELQSYIANIERLDSSTFNFSFLVDYFKREEINNVVWRINGNALELNEGSVAYNDSLLDKGVSDFLKLRNVHMLLDQIDLRTGARYSANLKNLSFVSGTNFKLNNLSSIIEYSDSSFYLSSVSGASAYSEVLIDTISIGLSDFMKSKDVSEIYFDATLDRINVGFSDLSFLFGGFYQKEFTTNLSGRVVGTLSDLRGRKFKLDIENFMNINGDFYLNGLPDIYNTYIFFDLNESFVNLNEIRNLDLPENIRSVINKLPDFLDNVGVFSYNGNFTGFLDNFVAYGTAYSNLGTISTDISIKSDEYDILKLGGNFKAVGLDVGKVFENEKLDKLSLSGKLNGFIREQSKYDLNFNGTIDSIDFINYRYRNIALNGDLKNELFNGSVVISDPNIDMTFDGKLDLESERANFEFVADIQRINLYNLRLWHDSASVASVFIDANFEGNNIDEVYGQLNLSDIQYLNKYDTLFVSSLILKNTLNSGNKYLELTSDLLDGEMSGQYSFSALKQSLMHLFEQYIPSSLNKAFQSPVQENNFTFYLHLKDLNPLANVVKPGVYIAPDILIEGLYSPDADKTEMTTHIANIRLGKRGIENLSLRLFSEDNKIVCRTNIDRLWLNDKINLYNLTLFADASNDTLGVDLFWNNYDEITYSGTLKTSTSFMKRSGKLPRINVDIHPSQVYIGDSLWIVEQSKIVIDSTTLFFDNINVHHNNQQFKVDGIMAEDEKSTLNIRANHVDLLLFKPMLGESLFEGELNGEAYLSSFYQKFMLDMDLSVNDLSFNNGLLGDLVLSSRWDHQKEKLSSEIYLAKGSESLLTATGYIDPLENELDMFVEADRTPVSVLEVFMPPIFYGLHGAVKGSVHVHGNFKDIMLDGALDPIEKAGIGVSYLKTVLSFEDAVEFSKDSIKFSNLLITDEFGNIGQFNGIIKHRTFDDMYFDLSIQTNRLVVMNTTLADNEYFYGTAYVSGNVDIVGDDSNVMIDGDIRSGRGTNLFIPFESSGNVQQYDFIKFVNNSDDGVQNEAFDIKTSDFNLNLDIDITPDAKVQLIFNSQFGDIIRGVGNGNLQVRVDRNYNFNLYGSYIIEEGDYLFSLQNLINKRFAIKQGSTIEWVGDPNNAIIDITSLYRVKTSLYDLFVNNYENIDLKRRIPVDCIIRLSEELTKPDIDFSIELPTAEERVKEQVRQVISTPEEVNKQMISLLMMGQFYTPEIYAGTPAANNAGVNLVGSTASDLIFNQLSNWLSRISNSFDLGINYRPGNEISDDQIELALSTQFFDDRVTINGNVANNSNPTSKNSSEIIGDVDLNVKLTDNGKLQLKVYNRSNDNLIYDTAPYTQGVGLTYREDFSTFGSLFERYTAFINRKKKIETEQD
ncbi:MAG: translocation/assembly module TamB [Prolixibacteraceae bacterium]|nr:translocation/assembly module TamB [Prolixibacteraceae bacterium]